MNADRPELPHDDHGEMLFAWALIAPVLKAHHSIVLPADRDVSVCVCSPTIRRTIDQWARHVIDEIASRIT